MMRAVRLPIAWAGSVFALACCMAAGRAADPIVVDLWPGKPPGETATIGEEKMTGSVGSRQLTNVSKPTLTVYHPDKDKDTGAAVIIAPGGAFRFLAWDHEGENVAKWFNSIGVTGIILKYRVPRRNDNPQAAVQDGQRAVSLVRSKAKEWGIDPDRIGMIGFSAGGGVTSYAMLNANKRSYEELDANDKASDRLNFAIIIYSALGLGSSGGAEPTVDKSTPPTFFAVAHNDNFAERTVRSYLALKKAGVPAELHVYASGGHGFGIRPQNGPPVNDWTNRLEAWMRYQKLLDSSKVQQTATAQAPRRQPMVNDTVRSPEVSSDHRVTFRIYAPKASTVTVGGDWAASGPVKLEKDDKGVWSATAGPLVPDFYSYSFSVDGVKTVDPRNAMIKQGISSLDSMVFVPGKEAEFEDNQKVPHGEIRQVWYESTTLGTQRRMHIYTPPGYEHSQERYPVFYLLHGGGDDDSGWSTIGRAGFILDNLLAGGKAKPMLIVMPNGSGPRPTTRGPAQPPGAGREWFTNELLKDIIPFVEKNYRVLPERENRALAGLSMGGGQTLRVVTTHPDQFAYVAVWSAGIGQNAESFEKQNAAFLDQADKMNKEVKLFSISVGDKDFTFAGSKNLAEVLSKHGIKNALHVSGGGHTWINWRHYLNDLAPRLFR
jgi:enterochelin esterase-like enzyme